MADIYVFLFSLIYVIRLLLKNSQFSCLLDGFGSKGDLEVRYWTSHFVLLMGDCSLEINLK